jgi:hypothetical protein
MIPKGKIIFLSVKSQKHETRTNVDGFSRCMYYHCSSVCIQAGDKMLRFIPAHGTSTGDMTLLHKNFAVSKICYASIGQSPTDNYL